MFKAAFAKLRHARGAVSGRWCQRLSGRPNRMANPAHRERHRRRRRGPRRATAGPRLLGAGRKRRVLLYVLAVKGTRARSTRGWRSACSRTWSPSGRATAPSTRALARLSGDPPHRGAPRPDRAGTAPTSSSRSQLRRGCRSCSTRSGRVSASCCLLWTISPRTPTRTCWAGAR